MTRTKPGFNVKGKCDGNCGYNDLLCLPSESRQPSVAVSEYKYKTLFFNKIFHFQINSVE